MRRRRAILLLALAGCGPTATSQSGQTALILVSGAQLVAGPIPDGLMQGPAVTDIDNRNSRVRPGETDKAVSGRVGGGGVAVAIGFPDDAGYWILPATTEDPLFPGELLFTGKASFSPRLSAGMHDLQYHAIDDGGRIGPARTLTLSVQPLLPSGDLVISLSWDAEADLDLHVQSPGGAEIWSRKITSYDPPPPPAFPDPDQVALAGFLDFDSNAGCLIDGRRVENVIWRQNAPAGHYVVRVDTYSLCGEPAARWTVQARLGVDARARPDGDLIGAASGISLEGDTRYPHQTGSGALALQLDVQ